MGLRRLMAGAAVCFLPAAAPASGHAGFLYPVLDDANGSGEVILEASFSDVFPVADIALKSDRWAIIGPDGKSQDFDAIANTDSRTVLQATLGGQGTYRFTSGERLGRTGEMARIEGDYVRIGSGGVPREDLPDRAEILSSQTATVSDIYLRRGADGAFPVLPVGRLAIIPQSDPTRLEPGDALTSLITFDGEAMANQPVTVLTPGGGAEGMALVTDGAGMIAVPVSSADGALVIVRHIAPAPAGADTAVRSYTTTLSVRAG